MEFEKLYAHSPIFVQNLMTSAKGRQNNKKRYTEAYNEYREFLRGFDVLPLSEQLEFQRTELIKFIRFAYDNTRFYRELYKDIDIDSIKTVEDLKKLPIITKEDLRTNIDDIVTVERTHSREGNTGGTTGKSLVIYWDDTDRAQRMAMLDHFKSRVGFEHRVMKRATFNGKHIIPPNQKKKVFWRYNSACKQMIFSSFNITEDNMQAYVDGLNKFKPDAIDGFFTSICDVAGYMKRRGIKPEFSPVAIFPTSETLTPTGRELLEEVFGCKVYDQYASSEGAPFICECREQHAHIELASGVFEPLGDGSDEVLVTSFTTHGTPLIRYKIGDSVVFSDEKCSCGLHSPLVSSIQGRRLDFLYTAEGAKINAGNVSNLFKYMPNVLVRAQCIQQQRDCVTILLQVDKAHYTPKYDEMLKEQFTAKFGVNTKLTIEHVEDIPREKSGKFRLIKNTAQ